MMRSRVGEITRSVHDDVVIVSWNDGRSTCEFRLDHVPNAQPRWVGSATDLATLTDRRGEAVIIEELIRFGIERNTSVALYHDDGRIEYLNG